MSSRLKRRAALTSALGLDAMAFSDDPPGKGSARAGRLVDVLRRRVLDDQLVRFEAGRITAVEPFTGPPPAEPFIDWSRSRAMPWSTSGRWRGSAR